MATNSKRVAVRDRLWRGATVRMLFIAGSVASLGVAGACSESTEATEELHATSISIFAGNQQSAEVARSLLNPLTVEVRDQNGRQMAGVAVNFTSTGDATILGNPAISDTLGLASVYLTFGTVMGAYKVTATVSGIADAPQFTLDARPGPAMALRVSSGDAQTGTCGTQLPTPFVVKVVDLFGNPIAGRTITWTASGGGTLSQSVTITGAEGTATVYLRLGATPGPNTVFARSDNLPDARFIAIGN